MNKINKKAIEDLSNHREFIKSEINRILSPLPKRDKKKEEQILEFLFNDVPGIMQSINHKVDFKQIKYLTSRSEKDIDRAKDAYKDGDLNNAVFHLQQSIEKMVKAYGLYLGIIKKEDLIKIGHNTPEVYLKLLKKSWIDKIPEAICIKTNIKKNIMDFESLIRNKKAQLELDKSTSIFLEHFKKVFKLVDKELSKREMNKVLKTVKKMSGIDIKRIYLTQTYFSCLLCPLAIITSIHAVKPRYSEEIEYEKLGLIKNFNEILKHLGRSVSFIKMR